MALRNEYIIEKRRINKNLDQTVSQMMDNQLIKSVTVITHGYSTDQINSISSLLQYNKCIDNLCIIFDADQDVSTLLAAIGVNIDMLTVVFPQICDDLLTVLIQIIVGKTVKKLRIDAESLSNQQLDMFTNTISKNVHLSHISIRSCKENFVNIHHIAQLANNSLIDSIELVGTSINEEQFRLYGCDVCLKIKSLTFDNVYISNQCCEIITDILKSNTSLQCLGFNMNSITDDVVDNLIQGIVCSSLKNIMVINNDITDQKLIDIITVLGTSNNICSILLGSFKNTSGYFKSVAHMLIKNQQIQLVELYVNHVDPHDYSFLQDAIVNLDQTDNLNLKSFIINLPNGTEYQHSSTIIDIFNKNIVPQLV